MLAPRACCGTHRSGQRSWQLHMYGCASQGRLEKRIVGRRMMGGLQVVGEAWAGRNWQPLILTA